MKLDQAIKKYPKGTKIESMFTKSILTVTGNYWTWNSFIYASVEEVSYGIALFDGTKSANIIV